VPAVALPDGRPLADPRQLLEEHDPAVLAALLGEETPGDKKRKRTSDTAKGTAGFVVDFFILLFFLSLLSFVFNLSTTGWVTCPWV
jgi:hypothetical protein